LALLMERLIKTQAVNINDFARYANRTRSVFVQIVIVPLS
jgi:cytosine/uracil/thiamine/allantoin permease